MRRWGIALIVGLCHMPCTQGSCADYPSAFNGLECSSVIGIVSSTFNTDKVVELCLGTISNLQTFLQSYAIVWDPPDPSMQYAYDVCAASCSAYTSVPPCQPLLLQPTPAAPPPQSPPLPSPSHLSLLPVPTAPSTPLVPGTTVPLSPPTVPFSPPPVVPAPAGPHPATLPLVPTPDPPLLLREPPSSPLNDPPSARAGRCMLLWTEKPQPSEPTRHRLRSQNSHPQRLNLNSWCSQVLYNYPE